MSSRPMLHVVAMLAIVASCRARADDATMIVLDSSAGRDSLEVVALPIDPASLRSSPAKPLSAASTAADSLTTLDARFQEQRTALNAEARALEVADRRSPEYSGRFDAWHRHAVTADSLRARRDKLRVRALHSAELAGNAESTLRATLLSARSSDGRAAIRRVLAGGDSVALDLSNGDWWVGAAVPPRIPTDWHRASGHRLVVRP
jgi:uncharacterized lipoprotein NlpE involved in copper resistance